jgi:hypothetical protein
MNDNIKKAADRERQHDHSGYEQRRIRLESLKQRHQNVRREA